MNEMKEMLKVNKFYLVAPVLAALIAGIFLSACGNDQDNPVDNQPGAAQPGPPGPGPGPNNWGNNNWNGNPNLPNQGPPYNWQNQQNNPYFFNPWHRYYQGGDYAYREGDNYYVFYNGDLVSTVPQSRYPNLQTNSWCNIDGYYVYLGQYGYFPYSWWGNRLPGIYNNSVWLEWQYYRNRSYRWRNCNPYWGGCF